MILYDLFDGNVHPIVKTCQQKNHLTSTNSLDFLSLETETSPKRLAITARTQQNHVPLVLFLFERKWQVFLLWFPEETARKTQRKLFLYWNLYGMPTFRSFGWKHWSSQLQKPSKWPRILAFKFMNHVMLWRYLIKLSSDFLTTFSFFWKETPNKKHTF